MYVHIRGQSENSAANLKKAGLHELKKSLSVSLVVCLFLFVCLFVVHVSTY